MTDYYDLATANERLTELRPLLTGLRDDRDAIAAAQRRLEALREDTDGDGRKIRLQAEKEQMTEIVRRMEAAVRQIDDWGISLRDISTGLIDFPALASGRPIWLCWTLEEDEIEFWHELDAGFTGRKPLIELE